VPSIKPITEINTGDNMTQAKPRFSKPSKMPCRSWSLQALDTCPASKKPDGELVDACKGCYATTGFYAMGSVKAPREHNREDWKHGDWVDVMAAELDNDRYFRWFDSGDLYSLALAEKVLEVMRRTPWCNHWLPTRMHKFEKFRPVLAEMEKLPNVVVRLSSDSVTGETVQGAATSSTIIPTVSHSLPSMSVCEAYERGGKCATCRLCWSKDVAVVAYPAHGKKMIKHIDSIAAINL
jgi:hypothetical protein